ncbi:hypothetical protein ACG74X_09430 [Marivita sp. S0852]|uniref:hypothetical protein n=1 Tax=Marivita sp. S0852 TaxID=3373893 RepID=UPI003981DA2B
MVSSNKILTVSYGTFSCTLEGFDHSFDTMKAIAEYFRDLAQDDRYFGAEPPVPDAEMLARIAEREIERRVEARFEKGNLVLRPTDEAEPPRGDVAPDPSSGAGHVDAAAGAAATGLAAANTLNETAERSAPDQDDTEIDAQVDDATEDAIEVSAPYEISAETAEADETAGLELDDASDELLIETVETDTPDIAPEPEQPIADAADDADTAGEEADLVAQTTDEDTALEDTAPDDTPDILEIETVEDVESAPAVADSVADKLQRIRAVVAAKPQQEPDYIEDEHAMSGPAGKDADETDAVAFDAEAAHLDDVDAAPTADAVAEDEAQADPVEQEAEEPEFEQEMSDDLYDEDGPDTELDAGDDNLFTDTIAAVVHDEIDSDEDDEAILPDLPVEEPTAEIDEATDPQDEIEALRAKIAELEALAAAPQAAPVDDDVLTETSDDTAAEDATPADAPLVLDTPAAATDDHDQEEVAEHTPIVARVSKAKRSDIEAALAAGDIEEYEEDAEEVHDQPQSADADPVPGADDSSLTAEQEAELARELAELQAEIDEDEDWNFDVSEEVASTPEKKIEEDQDAEARAAEADQDAEAEANIRKAVKLTSQGRAMLTDTTIEEDTSSVDRLIDQTETEMDEPEGNRRRSAIAHLRAAVAATKADRILGLGKSTDDEEEPYREDLADAVRPRRPMVTQTRSERPAPVQPAPLKLVAEQRVDAESSDDTTAPVRPRRVMRSTDAADLAGDVADTDGEGFAEFAENVGANTLPELLEAAAAYMSFVEGRDQFSRPQLMTKLHQAEGEASSREERLRSFGQLLRDGKIEKKGGGRFTASDNIGFKPDARAAG